jgi:hypothetical protein
MGEFMKIYGIILSVLFAGNAFAGTSALKVTCDLSTMKMWTAPVKSGAITIGVSDAGQIEYSGYTLVARLKQTCAADGGPCSNLLETALLKDGSRMDMSAVVSASDVGRKYSSSLVSEQETGYVDCTVE